MAKFQFGDATHSLFTNNDGVCCYMVSHNIMFIFDVGTNVVLEYVQSSSLVLGRDGNV